MHFLLGFFVFFFVFILFLFFILFCCCCCFICFLFLVVFRGIYKYSTAKKINAREYRKGNKKQKVVFWLWGPNHVQNSPLWMSSLQNNVTILSLKDISQLVLMTHCSRWVVHYYRKVSDPIQFKVDIKCRHVFVFLVSKHTVNTCNKISIKMTNRFSAN